MSKAGSERHFQVPALVRRRRARKTFFRTYVLLVPSQISFQGRSRSMKKYLPAITFDELADRRNASWIAGTLGFDARKLSRISSSQRRLLENSHSIAASTTAAMV